MYRHIRAQHVRAAIGLNEMKQCELWNVLQNEDERRLLDSADTKYDALITHIWALNNFATLFSNTVAVPAARH